jgi:addiction module RelE/StbE family toxin
MTIRWTPTASNDLEAVYDYIARDNTDAASAMIRRMVSGIDALVRNPELGRFGREAGSRELIVVPYRVIYRVRDSVVEILNIVHAARRWPPRS